MNIFFKNIKKSFESGDGIFAEFSVWAISLSPFSTDHNNGESIFDADVIVEERLMQSFCNSIIWIGEGGVFHIRDVERKTVKLPNEMIESIRWQLISSLLKIPQNFEDTSRLSDGKMESIRWQIISSLLKIPHTFEDAINY